MDTPYNDEPRSKPRWPLLLAILFLSFGSATVAWLAYSNSAYHRAIEFADRNDPGWRAEELTAKRAVYDDAVNGATKVAHVKSMLPKGWLNAKSDELLSDLRPEQLLNEQQAAAVRATLQAAGPAVTEARKMIDLPRGRFPFTYSPDLISTPLNCPSSRDVIAVLRYDVLDRAHSEDADGALAACRAMLHCGTAIGDEPFLISMLVRIACQSAATYSLERVLAQGSPSESALAAFQARIEETEVAPLYLIGIRGERAGQMLLLENIREGKVNAGAVGAATGAGAGLNALGYVPGMMTHQITGSLTFLNELVEIAKTPPETWTQPLAALEAKAPNLPVLAKLLAPAVTKPATACIRNHAHLRCATAAMAAERFRRKEGHWPNSLEELVKAGFLKTVPVDPFDGKPLRFKRLDDGLMVYSTGPDRTDDNGNLDRVKPLSNGIDWGLRLWDVPKRRQPAPPPKSNDTTNDQPAAPP